MGHAIFDFLRTFIADYGYWAVALALLCENAGIPVPGNNAGWRRELFAVPKAKPARKSRGARGVPLRFDPP